MSKKGLPIHVGGGMHDVPLMSDLWWNGNVIRIEWDDNQNTGNRRLPKGLSVVWNIHKIFIPPSIMDQKDTVVKMVEEAFSVDCDGAKKENVLSISVIMDNTIILTKEAI